MTILFRSVKVFLLLSVMAISGTTLFASGIKIQNANLDLEDQQLIVKGKIDNLGDDIEVILEDADIAYFFASQTTSKQFMFKIPISELDIIPCQIAIVAEDMRSLSDVKHAPDNCGAYRTTISGLITDEPIPFATVSVTIDGQTYTTVADENGAYSLEILTTNLNQLVKIESTATDAETGDTIDFVNLVGTFSKVLEGANDQNVTNVTSASYILAVEANGGEEPTTIEELEAAETSIDATELFELAAVIKLIVDDRDYSLPEGYDSIIEFIADENAVETYVEEVNATDPDAINNSLQEILADSNLVSGFTIDEIPERYYIIPSANPGFLARQGNALELNKDNNTGLNRAKVGGLGTAVNETFNWQIADGRLELSYPTPNTIFGFITYDIAALTDDQAVIDAVNTIGLENPDLAFTYSETVVSRAYTRVTKGNLVDIISLETRTSREPDPYTLANGVVVDLPPYLVIGTSEVTMRSSLNIEPIPFTTTCTGNEVCILGDWAGALHYDPGENVFGADFNNSSYGDYITFNADGTLTGGISDVSASWALDNGVLVVTYADGTIQRSQIIDQNGIEFGVFSTYDGGPLPHANYDIFVPRDTGFVFTREYLLSAPDSYWNGDVNTWIKGNLNDDGSRAISARFGWNLLADLTPSTSTNYIYFEYQGDEDPELEIGVRLRPIVGWSVLESGLAEIQRYTFGNRYWYPIASDTVDGDRVMYVMEYSFWNFGAGDKFFISPRINIYRELNNIFDRVEFTINDPQS